MLTVPVYDLLLLPGVTFYFKRDTFPGQPVSKEDVGESILFVMLRRDIDRTKIQPEDLFPIGISGKIEGFDEEESIRVRAESRVKISNVRYEEEGLRADIEVLQDEKDMSDEEIKERFLEVKKRLMDFAKGFQWGIWVRSMIYHWNCLEEAMCALAGYLNASWEEKYALLEMTSVRERNEVIEEALFELIEVFRVGEEAETAQKDSNEKLYRESALKKQIDFLQKQLDDLHPDNISDVRHFEKKIEEAGMNEVALREARKVLNRMKQEGKDVIAFSAGEPDFTSPKPVLDGC